MWEDLAEDRMQVWSPASSDVRSPLSTQPARLMMSTPASELIFAVVISILCSNAHATTDGMFRKRAVDQRIGQAETAV